jgi:hypothetical protein
VNLYFPISRYHFDDMRIEEGSDKFSLDVLSSFFHERRRHTVNSAFNMHDFAFIENVYFNDV